uniref:DRBM domain-containing protein n=1 Tax=Arundo donax TaxID=35708 RepID=A0A0A9DR18_ARUDO
MNYAIPSYICTKQASGVAPFICTVEIGGIQYIGAAARTKKEAEIKAARTALLAIQGRSEGCTNGATKYIVVPGQRQVKETEKKPAETPKPLKVKKGGYKKKWNKRKFMRKADQTVDDEKDVARVAEDAHDSDVPMQAVVTVDPSTHTTITQPDEEAKRVEHELLRDAIMVQSNEEATIAKQELPSGTEMLHDEARILEQEPSGDTAMVQHNKEARIVKQKPPSNTAMLQPGEEARLVELEPPRDTPIMQTNEEARSIKQETLSNAEMLKPKEEARTIVQESLRASVALQPNGEATNVKEEPPGYTAVVQPEEETISIKQELPSNSELVRPNDELMIEKSIFVYEQNGQSLGDPCIAADK